MPQKKLPKIKSQTLTASPVKIELKHKCLGKLHRFHLEVVSAVCLLGQRASLAAWVSEVRKVSLAMDWPGVDMDKRMEFRGDALELLTEYLFKSNPLNIRHGITGFESIKSGQDYGVDATGVNLHGAPTVIQCKFKSNPMSVVSYQDLAKTYAQGVKYFGIDPNGTQNLWVVTTCGLTNKVRSRGLSKQAEEFFGDQLQVLNFAHLSSVVDNEAFWQGFLASVQ